VAAGHRGKDRSPALRRGKKRWAPNTKLLKRVKDDQDVERAAADLNERLSQSSMKTPAL
jgi:hypothetical protein